MKRIYRYTCLMALGLVLSCSKDDGNAGNDYHDDFVFYVNATIDGMPMELFAGHEDYILDTDYDFDAQDSLVHMTGFLSSQDTTMGHSNAIMLRFVGHDAVANQGAFNLSDNVHEGNVALKDASGIKNDPDNFILNLTPDVVSSNYTYHWNFHDGSTSSNVSPSLQVSAVETPVYEVSLGADPYNASCSSKTTHFINVDEDCDATIIVSPNHVLGGLRASAVTRVGQVQSIKWFIDGANLSNDLVFANLPLDHDGNYRLRAEISFENGCQKVVEKHLSVLAGIPNFCDIDFSCSKDPIKINDPKQRGTVEIVYYDASGKKYSSNYDGAQGRFKIHNLRSFVTNDKGQRTARFQFEGRAILQSSDGSTVNLENTFGNFAVAHP